MKRNIIPWLLALCLFATLGFRDVSTPDGFQFRVQGLEGKNVLKEGLKPLELTMLTIENDQQSQLVTEFEIVLARGKSPIGIPGRLVKGNRVTLEEFRRFAKQGDRLVIKIRATSQKLVSPQKEKIFTIPIR